MVLASLAVLPIELMGPLAGPLGGGLAMVAVVLAAAALAARRRARREDPSVSLRAPAVGLLLGLAGVACALTVETSLILRERRERAEKKAAQPAPAEKQKQDKQLDDLVNDNLNR